MARRFDLHGSAEFQIIIASTLDDRRITHFHVVAIGFGDEFLFIQRRFQSLGQFRMFHFLFEGERIDSPDSYASEFTRSESTMLII